MIYIDVMGKVNKQINKSDLWNEMENHRIDHFSVFYYQVKDTFYNK